MRLVLILIAVILVTSSPNRAWAQTTYVSNLGDATTDGEGELVSELWVSDGFATGTSALGYNLNSVQVLLDGVYQNPSGFSISLYSQNGTQPGSSLGTLSGPSNPSVAGTYTYTASGITLTPSTDYWLVLADTSPELSGYLWDVTSSTSYTSSDGWSINTARSYSSGDQGTSWANIDSVIGEFAVNATVVPEPQSFALAAVALAALFGRRRKASSVAPDKIA